ncbi:MAG: DUF1722 domain-containing protein [Desulfamplus sp.]|nr:DUF1722 domain-containing protein [Desulfamplus sp.]
MRIWDVNPGYLNRQSLLGEHRELHGIVSIFLNDRKGYSRHPETLRWKGFAWALGKRHRLLSSEMALRGYTDKSPVNTVSNELNWPDEFIDEPHVQFELLRGKYAGKEQGRIPLPENGQQLWSHHKYSVMARDISLYREIGRDVSTISRAGHEYVSLCRRLTLILRTPPSAGGIRNSLQHMWGYVSSSYGDSKQNIKDWSPLHLLNEIRKLTFSCRQPYLLSSTALSDLEAWM